MKDTQTELLKEYADDILAISWRAKHAKAYIGNVQRVVRLSDGALIAIPKHKITTRFCYGHGYNGVYDPNEYTIARNAAAAMRSEEAAFIAENMAEFSPFDRNSDGYFIPYIRKLHNTQKIKVLIWYSPLDIRNGWTEQDEPLTADDEAILRAAYEEEKAVHLKKVKAYLKRYGLSKVRSWTYLVD